MSVVRLVTYCGLVLITLAGNHVFAAETAAIVVPTEPPKEVISEVKATPEMVKKQYWLDK